MTYGRAIFGIDDRVYTSLSLKMLSTRPKHFPSQVSRFYLHVLIGSVSTMPDIYDDFDVIDLSGIAFEGPKIFPPSISFAIHNNFIVKIITCTLA